MQTKKLESRQDVLDVWVSKGAKIYDEEVTNIKHAENMGMVSYLDICTMSHVLSIYELLYSPESNFFEVMFYDGLDKEKTREKRGIPTYSEIMKRQTVWSKDPLQYLLDKLNKTISS